MFPYPHLSEVPSRVVLDATAVFAPLLVGMIVLLGLCALQWKWISSPAGANQKIS